MIEAKKKCLLLRFGNYREYDFINEHKEVIRKYGYVWMLKVGKCIPQSRLDEVFDENRALLLKAPKSIGGKYYHAEVDDYYRGEPRMDMPYPPYYSKMLSDEVWWNVDSLYGTWLRITAISELGKENIEHLYLFSNKKPVESVLSSTRTSTLYVYSDLSIP